MATMRLPFGHVQSGCFFIRGSGRRSEPTFNHLEPAASRRSRSPHVIGTWAHKVGAAEDQKRKYGGSGREPKACRGDRRGRGPPD